MSVLVDLVCQTNFTVTLLQELGNTNSPVLYSPLYLLYGVLLTHAFSEGDTFKEFTNFLFCLPTNQKLSPVSYGKAKKNFVNQLNISEIVDFDDNVMFIAQSGFPFTSEYSAYLKSVGAVVGRLDFKSPKTVQIINKMMANMTNQRITQIVSTFNPDAVYFPIWELEFKDKWKLKFNAPKEGTFYVNATTKRTIPMMQQTSAEFGYLETEQFRALRLPFVVNSTLAKNCTMDTNRTKRKHKCPKNAALPNFHLLVFLPQKRFGLSEALGYLDGPTINELMDPNHIEIDVTLPIFDFELNTTFNRQLQKVGLKKGFDPKEADIPDIFANKRVYVGGLEQKIKFKINSDGADTLTGGYYETLLQKRSKRSSVKKFKADEPFVYMVIRENQGVSFLHYAGIFH
ncbi:SERPIN domain-containing protein [Aphelenchoides besseyi]|nr:SERPIN domain-containing protein [Aphelenchoides besseyi]